MKVSQHNAILPLLISLALVGCGGGDSNNTTPTPGTGTPPGSGTPNAVTISVIDGYLGDARVCVDRNQNRSCDADEWLAAATDARGQVQLAEADTQYGVIAQISAGETRDSDRIGYVATSYQLYASPGSAQVTPFTTLATLKNVSLSTLASQLSLPESVISGDFVAQKAGNPDAVYAHLMARSLVPQLAGTLAENDVPALETELALIKTEIDRQVNLGTDLNAIEVRIDHQGQAVTKRLTGDLAGYLDNKSFWFIPMTNVDFIPVPVTFKDQIYSSSISDRVFPYTVEDNVLRFDRFSDTFIHASEDLALSLSEEGRLYLWSEQDFWEQVLPLTAERFAGKTWYHLRDLGWSDTETKPALTKLDFAENNGVTVTPQGEAAITGSWEMVTLTLADKSTLLTLRITLPEGTNSEGLAGETQWTLGAVLDAGELIMVFNNDSGLAADDLLFQDPAFARSVAEAWVAAVTAANNAS
ncbi:hypothetical protein [Photobacterium sp. TY1-4]|uniref:hypothetical protein n=1 Tax=Photobacterium sp. TY1-4 TaxID=2899122 RepID=UPI0021BF56FD|nr:hypothetical protein [Photobacterium sp. TY1-4]UXI01370.1 hypothetical protein NH461_00395 [Photobacterium sp. TY1-4]